jgi:uncharacterized repeat protein (TIGR03803 family)
MKTTLKPFPLILLLLTATLHLEGHPPGVQYVKLTNIYGAMAHPVSPLVPIQDGVEIGAAYGKGPDGGTGGIFFFRRGFGQISAYTTDTAISPFDDVEYPNAGLALLYDRQTVYGTASAGGNSDAGGLYSYNYGVGLNSPMTGVGYKLEWAFNAATEGSNSRGTPVYNGVDSLYFTASKDGAFGGGTMLAYNINTGVKKVVYSFGGIGTATAINGCNNVGRIGGIWGRVGPSVSDRWRCARVIRFRWVKLIRLLGSGSGGSSFQVVAFAG